MDNNEYNKLKYNKDVIIMIKIKQMLFFAVILTLLIGIACASDVSKDTNSTASISEKAAVHDTHEVSDTSKNTQTNKADENIRRSKSSFNKLNENSTKTIVKNSNTEVKTATTINNWKELQAAVNNMKKDENLTVTLGKGTYTNIGTITLYKKNVTLTIEGNGQRINGNNKQLFTVNGTTTLVLKNIIITNANSVNGGAIGNLGNLIIINSTMANNTAQYGGAIKNRYGQLTLINSTLANNTSNNSGGAVHNTGRVIITGSTLANNTATKDGGAINAVIYFLGYVLVK